MTHDGACAPVTTEDEYKLVDEQYRQTTAFKLSESLTGIRDSWMVLDGNTRELEEELRELDCALSEFDWSNDAGGRAKISEINRRLQNYVTARMSLRDHTIRELTHLGMWDGSDWKRDVYSPKAQELIVKDAFGFLQDLRNYVAHNRSIPITAGIFSGTDDIEQHISLNVEQLKEWDDWKAPAKRFLGSQGKRIDIAQLVADYKSAVAEFYDWMFNELKRVHESEIVEAQALWDEHENLRRRLVDETGRRHG